MMNYKVIGEGETVVLVHGWGVTFNLWKEVVPRLVNRKLVVVQLPGMGESRLSGVDNYYHEAAQKLEELRLKLTVEKWRMIGYSMGTRVVEKYVQHHKAKVAGVILICPARAAKWKQWLAKKVLDSWMGDWVLTGWRLHGWVWWLGFNCRSHPEVKNWIEEIASQPLGVLKKTIGDLTWVDREFDLAGINTTMIWGKNDLVMDMPAGAEGMDGGHSLPIEQATEIVWKIEEVWTR